jgi:hypothetical protein
MLHVEEGVTSAMVEYSLDLDLLDIVFENPIIKVVSNTITEIGAYSNVCHSPNRTELFIPS